MKYVIWLTLCLLAAQANAGGPIKVAIYDAAYAEQVPPELLSAICFVESSHRNITVANDGGSASHGPCQVKIGTARMIGYTGSIKGLDDTYTNAIWAARYLKRHLLAYNDSWVAASAAYNAGSLRHSVDGDIVNRDYVRKVFIAIGEGR